MAEAIGRFNRDLPSSNVAVAEKLAYSAGVVWCGTALRKATLQRSERDHSDSAVVKAKLARRQGPAGDSLPIVLVCSRSGRHHRRVYTSRWLPCFSQVCSTTFYSYMAVLVVLWLCCSKGDHDQKLLVNFCLFCFPCKIVLCLMGSSYSDNTGFVAFVCNWSSRWLDL